MNLIYNSNKLTVGISNLLIGGVNKVKSGIESHGAQNNGTLFILFLLRECLLSVEITKEADAVEF